VNAGLFALIPWFGLTSDLHNGGDESASEVDARHLRLTSIVRNHTDASLTDSTVAGEEQADTVAGTGRKSPAVLPRDVSRTSMLLDLIILYQLHDIK